MHGDFGCVTVRLKQQDIEGDLSLKTGVSLEEAQRIGGASLSGPASTALPDGMELCLL